MVFSSITFVILFLPLVLLCYYLIPQNKRKLRNLVLCLFSLLFYAWGEPVYVLLMLISITTNYYLALLINKAKVKNNVLKAKLFLTSSILVSLGLLGFFKYGNFILNNINYLFGTNIAFLNLSLPIGISFYTFQIISYTIDVYRGKVKVQRNFINLVK